MARCKKWRCHVHFAFQWQVRCPKMDERRARTEAKGIENRVLELGLWRELTLMVVVMVMDRRVRFAVRAE